MSATGQTNMAELSGGSRRETLLVVCPGRGTYTNKELGYLKRYHGAQTDLLAEFDQYRVDRGQPSLSDLDSADKYSVKRHSSGDNVSALIYACALFDFLSIDRTRYDVVAVTGNSMGWYIALACAGALSPLSGLELVNHMGCLMHGSLIGGQLVYTLADEQWRPIPGRRALVLAELNRINQELGEAAAFVSIELGAMLVLAGTDAACQLLMERLVPEQDRFPLKLHNHAAFHTPLQTPVMQQAREDLGAELFDNPNAPLIDGRGQIWTPYSTDTQALWDYTLGHQVICPYDFTRAMEVSVKEFAPDRIVLLGPGDTLGGAVAQSLLKIGWQGLGNKKDFLDRQASDPILLAMGREEQALRAGRKKQ